MHNYTEVSILKLGALRGEYMRLEKLRGGYMSVFTKIIIIIISSLKMKGIE